MKHPIEPDNINYIQTRFQSSGWSFTFHSFCLAWAKGFAESRSTSRHHHHHHRYIRLHSTALHTPCTLMKSCFFSYRLWSQFTLAQVHIPSVTPSTVQGRFVHAHPQLTAPCIVQTTKLTTRAPDAATLGLFHLLLMWSTKYALDKHAYPYLWWFHKHTYVSLDCFQLVTAIRVLIAVQVLYKDLARKAAVSDSTIYKWKRHITVSPD